MNAFAVQGPWELLLFYSAIDSGSLIVIVLEVPFQAHLGDIEIQVSAANAIGPKIFQVCMAQVNVQNFNFCAHFLAERMLNASAYHPTNLGLPAWPLIT